MRYHIKIKTASQLLKFFWPTFVEVDSSVFLPWAIATEMSDPEHEIDRTGMEAFLSHTHMIDVFRHGTQLDFEDEDGSFYDNKHPDYQFLCEAGQKIAQMWFYKLINDFPHFHFRVYYTEGDDPIVRFHRVRENEPVWLEE